MSRQAPKALHHLAGASIVRVHQTNSTVLTGQIIWVPNNGHPDTATFIEQGTGKTASLNVDQLNWDNPQGVPWPHGGAGADANYTGTPVTPA